MATREIRAITRDDLPVLQELEAAIFGAVGEATLGGYLRFAAVERPRIRIRAGEPLAPSTRPAELAARCRAVIDRRLEEMS
jgi:hypothetical protein